MSGEFVTALHKVTGIISEVPEHYVTECYPDTYKVLSPKEIAALRKAAVEQDEKPPTPKAPQEEEAK